MRNLKGTIYNSPWSRYLTSLECFILEITRDNYKEFDLFHCNKAMYQTKLITEHKPNPSTTQILNDTSMLYSEAKHSLRGLMKQEIEIRMQNIIDYKNHCFLYGIILGKLNMATKLRRTWLSDIDV